MAENSNAKEQIDKATEVINVAAKTAANVVKQDAEVAAEEVLSTATFVAKSLSDTRDVLVTVKIALDNNTKVISLVNTKISQQREDIVAQGRRSKVVIRAMVATILVVILSVGFGYHEVQVTRQVSAEQCQRGNVLRAGLISFLVSLNVTPQSLAIANKDFGIINCSKATN